MSEEKWSKGMPPLHRFGNKILTKIFNLRHNSDFKDVTCGLVALSNKAFYEINWDKAPKGYRFDAWLRKEALRIQKEKGKEAVIEFPVDVRYRIDKKTTMKNKIRKYGKMFFDVLIECLK